MYISYQTLVEGDPKPPFSIANTPRFMGWRYSFSWIAPFTIYPYHIMLSVKEGSIKYRFFFVSRAIGGLSNHYANIYTRRDYEDSLKFSRRKYFDNL